MLRDVVDAPRGPLDGSLPVRLFAGSGMRLDVWKRLRERFPRANVLEFYASTEGNAVLANPSGKKVGSLGKALPGSADLALLGWDFEAKEGAGDFRRDERGHLMVAARGELGVLVARVDPSQPMAGYDGFEPAAPSAEDPSARLLRGVFDPGDAWFVTGDLMRADDDGDFWFVDRIADVVRTERGVVTTVAVEDALLESPRIARAIAYGVNDAGQRVLVAAIVLRDGELDLERLSSDLARALPPARRPRYLRVVPEIPLTDGYRARKISVQSLGLSPRAGDVLLELEGKGERYRLHEAPGLARA
jgi:putative long chain acyl-CoA synthase